MGNYRKWALDDTHREECTPEELGRMIFRFLKNLRNEYKRERIPLGELQAIFCPENKQNNPATDECVCVKFYESVARLKLRGLLVEVDRDCFGYARGPLVCLTSVGERSNLDQGVIILIDDAKKVVRDLKEKVHNLDPVVEQYYLESLRTCQNGFYISSVICLGAAAQRTINCLPDTVVQRYPQFEKEIDGNRRYISRLTEHLVNHRKKLFVSLEPKMQNELTENLEGLADIYRKNRNAAGHPKDVPQDWDRCEQECYLSQFRRLAATCYEAIDVLNRASAGS